MTKHALLAMAISTMACSSAAQSAGAPGASEGGASSAIGAGDGTPDGSTADDPASAPGDTADGGAGANASADADPNADAAAVDAGDDAGASLGAQMPQVASADGAVLTAPKVVLLSFPDDPFASVLEPLTSALASGSYWSMTTSEYGVGALTVLPPVHLSRQTPSSLSDADVRTVVAQAIAHPANALGMPDPSTIYTLLVPNGVPETGPGGATGCQAGTFGGYHHSFTTADGTTIPYAVILECNAQHAPTRTLAHELAEAATDPFAPDAPAFDAVSAHDLGYRVAGYTKGTEVGDMCEKEGAVTPADVGQSVARIWSNAAARAGKNPCVPVPPGDAFFITLPTAVPDTVTATLPSGASATGSGFALAQGATRAVPLGFLADGATGAWSVSAREIDGAQHLTLSLDVTSGAPGDAATLTITANDDTTGGVAFALDATSNGVTHSWFGVVAAP